MLSICYYIKYYVLLASGSVYIISSILNYSIAKIVAVAMIHLLISFIYWEGEAIQKLTFSFCLFCLQLYQDMNILKEILSRGQISEQLRKKWLLCRGGEGFSKNVGLMEHKKVFSDSTS